MCVIIHGVLFNPYPTDDDEEEDLPLFSVCFIIDGVHFDPLDPDMDDIVMGYGGGITGWAAQGKEEK